MKGINFRRKKDRKKDNLEGRNFPHKNLDGNFKRKERKKEERKKQF